VAKAATSRFHFASIFAANAPGHGTSPEYPFRTAVTRKHVAIMFKSVIRGKGSDAAFMRLSACLFARRDPRLAISFCSIGNMSKYQTEFPSADFMKRVKTARTSFSLPTSRRFKAATASVSPSSFKKLMTCVQWIVIESVISPY
jgi:hypothetical protein